MIIFPAILVFQITFQLDLSYVELADLGLSTLLKWNTHLCKEDMQVVLSKVLPSLDDYLQSASSEDSGKIFFIKI